MNKDLTVGNPAKILWLFCMPMFGSIIFQQLYNIADSFVAGKFISENALAAVGNSYEITLIFIAFAFGCNMGCSVLVSNFFGAKRYSDVKTTVFTTFIASAVICLALMLVGIFCGGSLLHLINTPANIFGDSELYLNIYIFGLPFVFFYNVSTGIFSALGDSKTPFIFLAVSSLSNIAADIWFVTGFGMGVDGIAWATFICQGVSCIFALIFVLKRLKTIKSDSYKIFDKDILKKFAVIAIPSILQQSFISVGNIIVQSVINGFGTAVIAGYSASIKLNNLVITSLSTMANGISNYTAQNLGANKPIRVKQGFKAGLKMVWLICIPLVILYFSCGKYLIPIFIENPSTEALSSGLLFLRIVSPFYFLIAAKMVSDSVLRGAGLMTKFMISTLTDLFLRVVLSFVLSATILQSTGIWCSWPIGWSVGTILSIIFYKTSKLENRLAK